MGGGSSKQRGGAGSEGTKHAKHAKKGLELHS